MNYIRKIKKLIVSNLAKAYFSTYQIGNNSVDLSSDIYFIDGVVGINSESKILTSKSDAVRYAMIIDKYESIISNNDLKDKDVFVGRNSNYILFRNGNQTIKSSTVLVQANEIDVIANKINFNGVELYSEAGKLKIKVGSLLKEVAVVGGTVNLSTGQIITSGQ